MWSVPQVTGFLVELRDDVSNKSMNCSKPKCSQECTFSGLEAERHYTVHVTAKKAWGNDSTSPPKTTRTDPRGKERNQSIAIIMHIMEFALYGTRMG